MLTEPHHFGITVSNEKRSRDFYAHVLRFPYMATSVNKGRGSDIMYRLRGAENHVVWFQIGDQGAELFHLPTHASRTAEDGLLARPGYRYAAFTVNAFDDYMARLEAKGAAVRIAITAQGRCARVTDPDGANLLFFEDHGAPPVEAEAGDDAKRRDLGSPSPSSAIALGLGGVMNIFSGQSPIGGVTGIKETGLVVADPEPYERYFQALGLENTDTQEPEFLEALFGYRGKIVSALYGRYRVLFLPDENMPVPPRMFPCSRGEHIDYYPDLGIKHLCYAVDDIDAFFHDAVARGVYFLFPPTTIPGGSRLCYFSDPEGHVIEAFQMPPALRQLVRVSGAARQAQMDAFSLIRRRIG
jgi:catechol 2,3-dioxygenase-like lactoylglutathione lyase family enzyme